MSPEASKPRVFKYRILVPVTVAWESCEYDDEKTAEWLSEVLKTIIKSSDHHVTLGKVKILGKGEHVYGNMEQVKKGDDDLDA